VTAAGPRESAQSLMQKYFDTDARAADGDPKAAPQAARLSLAVDAAILRERATRT
jgi:hypothetical protein